MSVFEVTIKWGKEKFPNVTLDTSEPPEVLRGQIFALTNVPPERQKIMAKAGLRIFLIFEKTSITFKILRIPTEDIYQKCSL